MIAALKVFPRSLLLLIFLMAISLPVFAQDVEAPIAPPSPETSASAAPANETAPASTHPFSSDREYDRLIRELEVSIPQRGWPIIAERLLDLQKVHPGILARRRDVVGSVPRIASQLISSLPAEGQQAYQRLAQQASSEKLQSAIRRSDIQAIEQVARQYRQTPAGNEALAILLKSRIDLGEWKEAALLLEGHFRSTPLFAERKYTRLLAEHRSDSSPSPVPKSLQENFPSLLADWEFQELVPGKTIETLNRTIRELRESGQSPYPAYSLIPIPKGIVLCGPSERIALDSETGQLRWRRPVPGYMTEWMRQPGDLGNGPRLRMFTFSVADSVFDNSVSTRTLTDGVRLFFVEPIPADDPVARPIEPGKEPFPANRIVCADAQTGKTEWMFNGEPMGGMFFSGPPAVFGNRLFALGQTSDGVVVLSMLDTVTGNRLQAMELSTLHSNLSQKDSFSGQSTRMEIRQSHLICATATGIILSIDPVFGEIEWAVQLPRVPGNTSRQNSFDDIKMLSSGFERWSGWQGVQLLIAGDRLIYGAPGSAMLTAMNAATGETDWQVPRGNIQHLAGSDDKSLVLAIARHQALGIDLSNGRTLWSVDIPEPAGRGLFDGTSYLFPILEQDFARLDLRTRSLSMSFPAEVRTPHPDGTLSRKIRSRQLFSAEGAAYTVSLEGVRKLQSPLQALAEMDSHSPWKDLISRAERGDWEQGFSDWPQLLQSSPPLDQPLVRETLRSLMSMAARQGEPSERQNRLRAHVAELSRTPLERAAWRQMQARDHLRNRDWSRFVSLWLTTPLEELQTLLPGETGDSRCRLDRWFQAAAAKAESGSPETAKAFRDELQQQLGQMTAADSAEVRRLLLCLGAGAAGKKWAFRVTENPDELQDQVACQLRWLTLAQDADPMIAAGAAERLLLTSVERKRWLDARSWLTRLRSYPGDLRLPSGRTVAAIVENWAETVTAETDASSSEDWPDPEPRLTQKIGRTKEVHLMPVPVFRGQGEFFSRLNVEVDFPGYQAIRFNGSASKRAWYQQLPRTDRNLRQEVGLDRVWTFGDFCVLQSGSEIFGISPQGKGKPRSSILWPPRNNSIDTLGSRENLMLSSSWVSLKSRPGFETASMRRVDEFGHYNAAVGPVRSDYLCLQQMGMLVLLETSTGQELWRRYDLPAQALVCGNESEVVVIAPIEETITRYRVLDGTELSRNAWTLPLSEPLQYQETFLLLEKNSSGNEAEQPAVHRVVLQQLDVSADKIVWQREWDPGSIPFEIDQQLIGMFQPTGAVELIDITTGRTVGTHVLPTKKTPQRIVASVSERDIIIVFSTEQITEPVPAELVIRTGYRHPFVAGIACCIERGTAKLLWQEELLPAVFRLDQPVDLPVFVTMAKASPVRLEPEEPDPEDAPDKPAEPDEPDRPADATPADEEGALFTPAGVILRCYDRRTGKLLCELKGERPFYSLSGESARHLVTLDTVKTRLEIDFSEPVEEPAGSRSGRGAAPAAPKR